MSNPTRQTATFGVWCKVSGGVTGTRQGWLKLDNGDPWNGSLAEAQQRAEQCHDGVAFQPSGCRFEYYPRQYI